MEENKKIGYGIIAILIAVIAISNAAQIIRYDNAEKDWNNERPSLMDQLIDVSSIGLSGVEHFTNKLDVEYFNVLSVHPVGFINYSFSYSGFRTVLYNVTFNFFAAKEVNGSIQVWTSNLTYSAFMTFDVAIANDRAPVIEGSIYKFFYVNNAYMFYNVVYYEKVETGRIQIMG